MRVLIVGCGYVGMPLGLELVRRGHKVSGLRRSATGCAEVTAAGLTPLQADITVADDLARLSADYDWVVNCVSSSGGGVDDYRTTYLQGARNLIEWLGKASSKLVYTSSTSVYGQTDGSWVDEGSVTEPVAETARVLLATEKLWLATGGVVLRVAGIYGPERGYWLNQFLRGEARLDGEGERWSNMVHRDDVVGALLAALEHGKGGTIYNVVDDEPVTQRACFEWLSRTLNKPMPQSGTPDPVERKRGATNKRVSNRRIQQELGWRLKYPTFRDGFPGSAGVSPAS
jgi:nucleoside-diphosphate-sugar epimerase